MISSLFKKLYNWSYTILSNTLANTEMIELGRQSFKSSESPFLNDRVTLAYFQSLGNVPDIRDY